VSRAVLGATLALALCTACGAPPAEPETPEPAPAPEAEAREPEAVAEPEPEPTPEPAPAPEPEPEPEPAIVEAGRRLGPVTIGMTREEAAAALGEDSPYRLSFDGDTVEAVEVFLGDLPDGIAFEGTRFPPGTHIHVLRDAFGGCVWEEQGGEYYRCRDGALVVHTTHTLDPARYTLRVAGP
jgi:hypothetical protein